MRYPTGLRRRILIRTIYFYNIIYGSKITYITRTLLLWTTTVLHCAPYIISQEQFSYSRELPQHVISDKRMYLCEWTYVSMGSKHSNFSNNQNIIVYNTMLLCLLRVRRLFYFYSIIGEKKKFNRALFFRF